MKIFNILYTLTLLTTISSSIKCALKINGMSDEDYLKTAKFKNCIYLEAQAKEHPSS